MKKNVMMRAHQIAKSLEGDYRARLSLALRQAWKEEKEVGKEQELRKRLQEIAAEAKAAKSDAVLSALAAERREILRQIGKKCRGCGKFHLPENIKYGVCRSCYISGNAW
jgi:hypothetical protein